MTQNDAIKVFKCVYCTYYTKRHYDLKRHHNAKHKKTKLIINTIFNNYENNRKNEEIVTPNEENVTPNEEIVTPNEEIVTPNFICKKCNKVYNTNRYLIQHEKKCTGVDDLTCPRCMISFTTRQAKSKHMKKNNCKPRSIIHARTPNSKIIETVNNITNIQTQNNYTNITNVTNNLIINNYGNERIDYLNYEKMLEIFKKAYDIPSLLTKEIHFNNNFPENNNIIYKNENTSLIKYDDEFILKGLNELVLDLITEKTKLMQKFAIENKEDICLKMDSNIYEDIIELLIKLILLKEPSEHYKKQVNSIRDMIKNSKII
jgi:hypothetical protein